MSNTQEAIDRKILAEQAKQQGDYFWAYSQKNAELHGLMHQCQQMLAVIDKCQSIELVGGNDLMFDVHLKILRETVEQYWEEHEAQETASRG